MGGEWEIVICSVPERPTVHTKNVIKIVSSEKRENIFSKERKIGKICQICNLIGMFCGVRRNILSLPFSSRL